MGKFKFKVGDKVGDRGEKEKKGEIVGYHKETNEYQVRLENGESHYVPARRLEKLP